MRSPSLTSSSHLLSPLVSAREREGEREGERENIVKLEQDGNKEDGYSGPAPAPSLPARDSIAPACLVGVYRCGGRAIHSDPKGRRAGRHQGGLGGVHSPGTSTHYMHDGCETLLHTHTQAGTLCSPRINQTFSDDGRPSVAGCGWGLFGR